MNKRTFLKSLAAIGAFFATPAIPAPEIATEYKFARKVPETVTELYDTMNSVLPFVTEVNLYTRMFAVGTQVNRKLYDDDEYQGVTLTAPRGSGADGWYTAEANTYTATPANWPWPDRDYWTEQDFYGGAVGVNLEQCLDNGLDAEAVACRWAWRAFMAKVAQLDDPKSAVLYWRSKPTFWAYFDSEDGAQKAKIYLRYLISSRGATNG